MSNSQQTGLTCYSAAVVCWQAHCCAFHISLKWGTHSCSKVPQGQLVNFCVTFEHFWSFSATVFNDLCYCYVMLFFSWNPFGSHSVEVSECHTSLQCIFLFFCAIFSAPTYHYEAPLFTLQLIEKGLSRIRRQSELIKVSRWHTSIAIMANLPATVFFFNPLFSLLVLVLKMWADPTKLLNYIAEQCRNPLFFQLETQIKSSLIINGTFQVNIVAVHLT